MANTEDTESRQSNTLLQDVTSRIGGSTPAVRERVVGLLVEREIGVRTEALDKALAKRVELEREMKKLLKPDFETFDGEGKVTASGYTKARADEIKKAREQLEKIEKAIDQALTSDDFAKLKELMK